MWSRWPWVRKTAFTFSFLRGESSGMALIFTSSCRLMFARLASSKAWMASSLTPMSTTT